VADAGGHGGSVDMGFVASTVITGDDDSTDSHGVVAQSIGGGGGVGGSSVANALAVALPTGEDVSAGAAASAAIGGTGGNGGGGSSIDLQFNSSQIATQGDGSFGIIAHSIGGGGGLGGSASSLAGVIGTSDAISADISMSVGASGGGGGSGGDVVVGIENQTTIQTAGNFANAFVAQSIGGGGGNASVGSAGISHVTSAFNLSATIGLGGTGNQGGNVTVLVDETSMISTEGTGARGIVAQTIGGGGGLSQGGSFGLSVSGESTDSEGETSSASASVSVGLGNAGGAGSNGNGAAVTSLVMQGIIQTAGTDADAIMVQSIGGGGGLGGSMGGESDGSSDDADTSYALDLTLGGSGGVGGNGATAEVLFAGQINTSGDWADGIVVQSVGGGGGSAGTATIESSEATTSVTASIGGQSGAGGAGGAVTVTLENDADGSFIMTRGYGAIGVLAQSIGGGGGQGGDGSNSAEGTISLGIDGATSYGSAGGVVTVSGETNIATLGAEAHGVVAQSIGGGGGIYGAGNALAAQEDGSHSLNLSLGARHEGGASDGAEVSVDLSGTISTAGDLSFGILAHSIGGGGGMVTGGGSNSMTNLQFGAGTAATPSASDGAQVDVSFSSGTLSTTGMRAHGLVAQSIGGGGGIAGDFVTGAISLSDSTFYGAGGNDTGAGAAVIVNLGGDIVVQGRQAYGIIAQSIGRGGGFGGTNAGAFAGSTGAFEGARGGTVNVQGNVSATGDGGVAIFAQSQGTADAYSGGARRQ
jgi:hypothetical protein